MRPHSHAHSMYFLLWVDIHPNCKSCRSKNNFNSTLCRLSRNIHPNCMCCWRSIPFQTLSKFYVCRCGSEPIARLCLLLYVNVHLSSMLCQSPPYLLYMQVPESIVDYNEPTLIEILYLLMWVNTHLNSTLVAVAKYESILHVCPRPIHSTTL